MGVALGELAVRFGCELRGDPDAKVERVATLAKADARSLSFLANPRYKPQLALTQAGAVVLDAAAAKDFTGPCLVCQNPYVTYARIAAVLHPKPHATPGVHPSAVVAASAHIDPTAHVGALCVIGERAVIGPRVFVGPQCLVDDDVTLAEDVHLVARVTLCRAVELGARTVLQPGVIVGGDGFGFAPERGQYVKVPQVGTVRIGADVEIGANTTVDRGALDDTVIEEGVKLDNLIQIAHNVRIGAHTVIAACTGVSGSTIIGKRCMIGGGVGFGGHLTIADDVVITGTSMVSHSIGERGVYSSGIPFEKAAIWRRMVARFKRLDRFETRLKKLEGATGAAHDQEENDD